MIGQGLQQLLQSPMAGGQQGQFPDPTDIVKQIMQQFQEYVRKRGTGASMGRQVVQQPVGIPPRERAGRMRSAGMEGVSTFMGQAGEAAAEPWKPKALDIGLMAASIALPIIAAMQPEGRGRRGQRKQQRKSAMLKTLGELAGKGLGARKGSFEAGKEATYGAAETRAELAGEEVGAKYEHEIGQIGAERKAFTEDRAYDIAEDRVGLQRKKLEWEMGKPSKPEKPLFTPHQQYQMGRNIEADQRREQKETEQRGYQEADSIWLSLPFATEAEGFKIDDAQSLNRAISRVEHLAISAPFMAPNYQKIAQQLIRIRDQISGQGGQTGLGIGETPLTPEEKAELEARRQRR